ncbi:hypothetical protein [Robertkochia sediminum]|uniref:hypothetical protein n=1 Tax=Robertkochia sediminum TaxID=2785326 RepID=UPI001932B352|nr:hypothetical protein [Robertkochia sediminum]MBL7472670.1 hypothetical protein [Robertkochia sediminum]
MKIIKFISVFTLFLSFQGVHASTTELDPGKDKVVSQLTELLRRPGIKAAHHDLVATVHFMVNRSNEIVVIEVEAENDMLEAYIKSRLNYKEINCDGLASGEEYIVPVRIKAAI